MIQTSNKTSEPIDISDMEIYLSLNAYDVRQEDVKDVIEALEQRWQWTWVDTNDGGLLDDDYVGDIPMYMGGPGLPKPNLSPDEIAITLAHDVWNNCRKRVPDMIVIEIDGPDWVEKYHFDFLNYYDKIMGIEE